MLYIDIVFALPEALQMQCDSNGTATIFSFLRNFDLNGSDTKRCSHWNRISGDRDFLESVQFTYDTVETLVRVTQASS